VGRVTTSEYGNIWAKRSIPVGHGPREDCLIAPHGFTLECVAKGRVIPANASIYGSQIGVWIAIAYPGTAFERWAKLI